MCNSSNSLATNPSCGLFSPTLIFSFCVIHVNHLGPLVVSCGDRGAIGWLENVVGGKSVTEAIQIPGGLLRRHHQFETQFSASVHKRCQGLSHFSFSTWPYFQIIDDDCHRFRKPDCGEPMGKVMSVPARRRELTKLPGKDFI